MQSVASSTFVLEVKSAKADYLDPRLEVPELPARFLDFSSWTYDDIRLIGFELS